MRLSYEDCNIRVFVKKKIKKDIAMASYAQKKQKVQATRKRTKKRLQKSGRLDSSASYLKRTTTYSHAAVGQKRKRAAAVAEAGLVRESASQKPRAVTSEHIRVFQSASSRHEAMIKAYKAFRERDGRHKRRVVLITGDDKAARSLPHELGAKKEKKK